MKILKESKFAVLNLTAGYLVEPYFFFNLQWNQGPLGTAATNSLLCQPRVIMMMEKSVE
jgi:hypothetical protein